MTVAEAMPELRGKWILCTDDVFRLAENVELPPVEAGIINQ